MRPISNVVDITNYVMLGIGSPTHALRRDEDRRRRADGAPRARRARRSSTLDGKARTLDPDMLVIADAERAERLAGIMGGEGSEIGRRDDARSCSRPRTSSATASRAPARRSALRTDSAGRWDPRRRPYLAPQASAWAAELLVELAGAQHAAGGPGRGREAAGARADRAAHRLREQILGMPIDDAEETRILGAARLRAGALDGSDRRRRDGADVAPEGHDARDRPRRGGRPHPRPREAAGDHSRPHRRRRLADPPQAVRRRGRGGARGAGLHEAYTLSLVDAGSPTCTASPTDDPRRGLVPLQNPLSADYAFMRRCWCRACCAPCGATVRPGGGAALFEIAHLYHAPAAR